LPSWHSQPSALLSVSWVALAKVISRTNILKYDSTRGRILLGLCLELTGTAGILFGAMQLFIRNFVRGLLLVPALVLGLSFVAPVAQAACNPSDLSIAGGANCARGNKQPSELFGGDGSIFRRITSLLLFLVGAISVIMLIIGGIRYIISGGDQNQVTSAKNTILYAIVGIVVAFIAYAAVSFVIQQLQATSG
jgi:hypothetical protein